MRRVLVASILAVIATGIAIRIFFALSFGFDWDTSILLYQAQLASHGAAMFSEIRGEDPLYVYLLASMLPLFGAQIWIFKLLSGASSLIIAAFVFLIGNELFGKRIGLLSVSLYLLIPVVAIFDVQGTYRTVFQLPVLASLFLILIGLRSGRQILLITGGILTGVNIFLYAGSLYYGLLLLTIPLVYRIMPFANRARKSLTILFGLILGVGLGTLILILLGTNLTLLWLGWLPSITTFAGGASKGGGRFSSLSSFADYLSYITRYLYIEARDWIPEITLGVLYMQAYVLTRVQFSAFKKKFVVVSLLSAALFLFFLGAIYGVFLPPHGDFGLFDVISIFNVIYFAEILILISFVFVSIKRFRIQSDTNHRVMLLWILWLLLLLGSFQLPHGFYFQFLAVPLSILGGYMIQVSLSQRSFRFGRQRHLIAIALVIFLSISSIVGGLMFLNSNIGEWTLSSAQVSGVGTYLRMHTNPSDYVFTAAPIYALAAGRANAGNMDNYFYFVNTGVNDINYSTVVNSIYTLMKAGDVKYVILDPIGRTQGFIDHYPLIQNLFNSEYGFETSIEGASIWKFESLY